MAQNTDGYRKQINNVNDLPGFDKMYLFAGAPTREFDKTFRYFLSCLGNITQDGSSLLDIRTIKQILVPVQAHLVALAILHSKYSMLQGSDASTRLS